jgi:retron-type reverse transcriptase
MLKWSFQQLRKAAAAGVDGITAGDFEKDLESNLKELYQRLKAGRYQAQPLRRVHIEKEDGKKRPLSIPGLEDKLFSERQLSLSFRALPTCENLNFSS